ncbi:hypothetical protein BD324DRAFT_233199 [Kockovaella imperatae]|uniref:Uncharacterized protein n=1 Tax=Kockovaella imperatae TaxID=4999 RepID=A0A1Y1UQP8_9TREE|nr:hypothetical protein BD324DRAFT_233199 [Kockovaella imperatae]ORX39766.1 hypothetical protein BD324DRAFT_233199 [Kockovaella imperatae]
MTTLDPSHNIFRDPSGRHAQAVHRADDIPLDEKRAGIIDGDSEDEVDDLSIDDRLPARVNAERKAKRDARRRVRGAMPPMPDLRYEQSYLLSIRPFLSPSTTASSSRTKSTADASQATTSLVQSADNDAVFGWDKRWRVDWSMVIYVTIRDQLFSPLIQGALWGWGTLFLAATATSIRAALYPASHILQNRVTLQSDPQASGLMGDLRSGAGRKGEESGWWRRWVSSWGGGVETATVG